MKIEEIREQCESLSNEELLLVVNNKIRYTEKIVKVAYQEIRKRNLSPQEVKEIKKAQARRAKIITGDIHVDIFFLEKLGLFFLCFPRMHALISRRYRRQGYELKARQTWYFGLSGLFFLLLSISIGIPFHSWFIGGIIWIAGFLIAYFLNRNYFKEKIMSYLAARSVEPES